MICTHFLTTNCLLYKTAVVRHRSWEGSEHGLNFNEENSFDAATLPGRQRFALLYSWQASHCVVREGKVESRVKYCGLRGLITPCQSPPSQPPQWDKLQVTAAAPHCSTPRTPRSAIYLQTCKTVGSRAGTHRTGKLSTTLQWLYHLRSFWTNAKVF